METYTRAQVKQMLVSMFVFAGSNSNQGISSIKGDSYGEKAETVLDANDSIIDTNKSIISVVAKFK